MNIRILKSVALGLIASSVVVSAFAVNPGVYMGISTGYATNNGGTQQAIIQSTSGPITTVEANPSSQQWGERLFFGYKLNKYASMELGGMFFSTIHYDTKKNVTTCANTGVRVRDIDFTGKGEIGFRSVTLFGQAGIAGIYETTSGDLNPIEIKGQRCGRSEYNSNLRPIFGVGVSYDLNQNWVVSMTYTQLLAGKASGTVTYYGLGISYHIVDVYCGQFLCN